LIDPVGARFHDLVDAGEFLLLFWVGRLLPRLGLLKGDVLLGQDLAEALLGNGLYYPALDEVAAQLVEAPGRKREPEC